MSPTVYPCELMRLIIEAHKRKEKKRKEGIGKQKRNKIRKEPLNKESATKR